MVIRLDRHRLALDDLELIDHVVEQRRNGVHGAFFQRILPQWKERVAWYVEVGGNPERIGTWDKIADTAVHGRFKNLYLSPQSDSVQKPILDRLRERTLDYCPACGEDGTPNTLDHYLPKDLFPEFSITPANLFPMCDICQGRKGTATVSDEGRRLFLHPYFDAFLGRQVVVLDIGGPFNAPASIALAPHPDVPGEIPALVARHLHHLEVVSRFHHFFRSNYLRLLRLVRRIRREGLNVIVHIEQFRNMALDKSVNSWAHVFYDGVLRNNELLAYLETENLPEV